jgi:thioredoxin-related protein
MFSQVLAFTSDDCHACKVSKPIVEKVARASGIIVKEHDPMSEPALAQRFNVNVLPTFVLVDDRGEFCGEVHGLVDERTVRQLFACACSSY